MMHPYPRYAPAVTRILAGIWDFAWLGNVDLDGVEPGGIEFAGRMAVPGAFDACPDWAGRRGVAAYRLTVPTTPGRAARLRCDGAGLRTRVYVDDEQLAACDLPYSGFAADVPSAATDLRELVMLVDNRFDAEALPLMRQWYDFYAYGGLYRAPVWREVPAVHVERARVTPLDLAAGRVALDLELGGAVPATVEPTLCVDGTALEPVGALPVTGDHARCELTLPDPRPWSPAEPLLHELTVVLGEDLLVERFGLRTVATHGAEILVNGEPVLLRGCCRHEAHPAYGPALPPMQQLQDLQLLRAAGCNFVRGSHYPQDQGFLDLCDELGVLVFEEALGWGHDAEQWAAPRFLSDNQAQIAAMVGNSYNHPAVIIWGLLNEGGSHDPAADAVYAELLGELRARDPARLITYASNRVFEGSGDRHLTEVDLVSLNCYPGWYSRDHETVAPLGEIVPLLRRWCADADATGGAGKPLILSEIGAGALYGHHDPLRAHWSEEYQADYLRVVCTEILANPRIAGVALWQFCDCRTYATARALGRPRAFNNKGLVDEWRRPKLGYQTVREIFEAVLTAPCALSRRFPMRDPG